MSSSPLVHQRADKVTISQAHYYGTYSFSASILDFFNPHILCSTKAKKTTSGSGCKQFMVTGSLCSLHSTFTSQWCQGGGSAWPCLPCLWWWPAWSRDRWASRPGQCPRYAEVRACSLWEALPLPTHGVAVVRQRAQAGQHTGLEAISCNKKNLVRSSLYT